jgi:hypothetical protein
MNPWKNHMMKNSAICIEKAGNKEKAKINSENNEKVVSSFTPYQEWHIYGVQGVSFLQLLLVAFLYLRQGRANIFHALRATLSATMC